MIDVSKKKETFRRALASGKIYVGDEVFELIKNKEMPKGDPITLAEVSAVIGVKKTSELIPLCHLLTIDHTATKILMNEEDKTRMLKSYTWIDLLVDGAIVTVVLGIIFLIISIFL